MILTMKLYWHRLVCSITGHVRGSRLSTENGIGTFACRRCGEQWKRKDRKPKAA